MQGVRGSPQPPLAAGWSSSLSSSAGVLTTRRPKALVRTVRVLGISCRTKLSELPAWIRASWIGGIVVGIGGIVDGICGIVDWIDRSEVSAGCPSGVETEGD